jgi:hypothetical protein
MLAFDPAKRITAAEALQVCPRGGGRGEFAGRGWGWGWGWVGWGGGGGCTWGLGESDRRCDPRPSFPLTTGLLSLLASIPRPYPSPHMQHRFFADIRAAGGVAVGATASARGTFA